jgi:hypothetical protein
LKVARKRMDRGLRQAARLDATTVEDRRRASVPSWKGALKDSLRRWWDPNQELPGEGRTKEYESVLEGG